MKEKSLTAKSLGKRLRQERERLGLSQKELAEAAGVRRITVYQYERGDRRPSTDFIVALLPSGFSLQNLFFGEHQVINRNEDRFVDVDLAVELHMLVDQYGVDSKGRLLQSEYRNALFAQLLEMAINLHRKEVDLDALHEVLESFAA